MPLLIMSASLFDADPLLVLFAPLLFDFDHWSNGGLNMPFCKGKAFGDPHTMSFFLAALRKQGSGSTKRMKVDQRRAGYAEPDLERRAREACKEYHDAARKHLRNPFFFKAIGIHTILIFIFRCKYKSKSGPGLS